MKAQTLQLDPDDDEAEQKIRMDIERESAQQLDRALGRQLSAVTATAPGSVDEAIQRARAAGEPVRDTLRRMLQLSADLGVSVAVNQFDNIGFGFDWTLANQAAAEWVNQYTFDLVSRINRTTERRLQTAVSEWITNGEPLRELRKELERMNIQRAELIASTETTRAFYEANKIAYQESGVVSGMQWVTANDERVCPVCGPLGGLTVDDGEVRPASIEQQERNAVFSGLNGEFVHPIDGGTYSPPAHPRCRCGVVPVIE